MKMFQYASNQKCKLLQYIPLMYQKSKWYKEVGCPGTEGSVEMNILFPNQQECKLSQSFWKIFWQYILHICQVITL